MRITKNTKLTEIQTAFTKAFPHLKIEFYKSRHRAEEGTESNEMLDVNQNTGEVTDKASSGELSFDGSVKISDFENLVLKDHGLNVQVFRRSGNLWLQTTTTDKWTLAEANRKGGRSEELYNEPE